MRCAALRNASASCSLSVLSALFSSAAMRAMVLSLTVVHSPFSSLRRCLRFRMTFWPAVEDLSTVLSGILVHSFA